MLLFTNFRCVKRFINIALVMLILASITLLAEQIANQLITVQANKDKSSVFVERSDSQALSYSKYQPGQEQTQPFVGAVNGKAFMLKEVTQGVDITQLKTALPVFKAFGLSKDERKILYTSLKNGNPSGELYLEDFSTRKLTKVTSRLVLTAALSPSDDNHVAYTFAGGETFGLELAELDSGRNRTLVSENVFAEHLQWDNSGKGIHYFKTANEDTSLTLATKYVSVDSLFSDNPLQIIPVGFPMLEISEAPKLTSQTFVEDKVTNAKNTYSFRTVAPDGAHEVVGSNLLGVSRLSARQVASGKITTFGEGQLLKVLQTGVIIKEFSSAVTKLQFVNWEGQTTSIGMMVVNYNLPLQNSTMIQGGTGYASPGNCNISAHSGALEYAYDFQTPVVGAHAMASADGLVVFTTSSVTCNTIETSCPDYSAGGCPGSFLGNVVIIQHADGTYTKYAHMQTNSPQVVVGTNVCQGLYIGRQGHTGSTSGSFNSCGDHLHFQRQSSPDIFGQSVAVDFADVAIEPLSCGTNYISGSTEVSHSISPTTQNVGITGGNDIVNVTSTGCNWSAASNDNWITITSPGSGSGNDVVAYSVADNSTGSPRIGTMNIAGHIFTVSQNGTQPLNQAPTVNAGNDQTITLPTSANLSGTATDDGLPNPPAILTTTWSKVSGPGTVTFGDANALNTSASFSLAGVYVLRLTADDSALTGTDDLTVIVNINNGGGTLSGTQTPPPSNVNLTTEGTLDWSHWGLTSATSFNHKNGVTQQISDYAQIGTVSVLRYTSNPNSYSWTDGTPTSTTSDTTTGVYLYEIGNGFQLSVPADTTPRTLKLYLGVWAAGGKLEATLSDGSASPYIDTSLISGGVLNGVYTLNYKAATSGQTLTLKWIVNSNTNPVGNITLQAASLVANLPSPTNQAPTVNAGSDQNVTLPNNASLVGTAADDGLPNPPATLTTTWSKVSGPGTVTFGNANALNTTASFSSAGVYVLRLTADDSALTATDDLIVTVNDVSATGLISANQTPAPSSVNLTTEGTSDWSHWGLTSATSFNHKNGVAQQISNYGILGSGTVQQYANNSGFYSWSDGTPTATATNTPTGVYVIGLNNGFQVTVPADTTQKTLKLYVGLWSAGGKLEATLSDGSSPPYIDTSLVNSSGTSNAVYTIKYRAGASNQTLTVRWTVNTTFNNWSNVTLQAATIQSSQLSVSQTPAPASVNLTTEGTLDWSHWGLTSPTSFNHKSGVTQQISDYTPLGSGTVQRYTNNPGFYSWSDGTPTSTIINTATGIYVIGLDNGFELTFPADTIQKTLKLYVGLWSAGGKLEATLSDGSSPPYIDTSLVNSSGTSNAVYTIDYRAGASNQTLTVRWTVNTTFHVWSNVTLQAATIQPSQLSVSQTPAPSSVNLTTEGTSDWSHWGLTSATSFNHKNGVAQQISNYGILGSGTVQRYTNNPGFFSWSDGTPTATATNTPTGVYVIGLNNGFQVTVPADTTQKTLKLYVGLWSAGGKLEATLSDGSSPPYIDTSLVNSSGTSNAVYTIKYRAGASNQTLTVRWTVNTTFNNWSNVTLQAATLVSNNGLPTNQAPLVDAGSDQNVMFPNDALLVGTSSDDGLPNPPNTLTTTWSKVSGPGTVTFGNANALNTTASFSSAGVYVLRLTANDSALVSTDDLTVTVSVPGVLSVSSTSTPTNINLTMEGTLDWSHWGLSTATSFNHKNGVAQQISNYGILGSGTVQQYANNPNFYSWSDGTPTATATNTPTGVYVIGLNNGFQVTVPADTTQRTLKLYVGLWSAGGKLEATLSDGSSPPYIDTSLVNSSGTSSAVYTLNYQAGTSGQTLVVKWTVNTTFNNWSNVTLQAAALN